MSHDDHGHEPGGHELDKMPNGRLFNLLFGLSALTLLSCIGVIQLFNMQVRGIEDERNRRPSFQLAAYREEMASLRNAHGMVVIADDDGLDPTKKGAGAGKGPHQSTVYRMPIADARALVLEDAKALAAPPAYRFWVNPDPALAEGTPAAGARPVPVEAPDRRPPPAIRPGARPTPGARPAPGGAVAVPERRGVQPAAPPPREAPEPKPDAKADAKAEPKPATPKPPKPAKPAKPDGKPDAKAEPKPAAPEPDSKGVDPADDAQ